MAGQFQMAHSREVVGAAIIAGGPYGCSESLFADVIPGPGTVLLNLTKAINGCMLNSLQAFGVPNPQQLAQRAGRLAERNLIDPIDDVKKDRLYLLRHERSTVVRRLPPPTASRGLGVPAGQSLCSDSRPGMVSSPTTAAPSAIGQPCIIDCDRPGRRRWRIWPAHARRAGHRHVPVVRSGRLHQDWPTTG
jgi:hypothetical protein